MTKYYCNPLDSNSTLNMDNGSSQGTNKVKRYARPLDTPKVHPIEKIWSREVEYPDFCEDMAKTMLEMTKKINELIDQFNNLIEK